MSAQAQPQPSRQAQGPWADLAIHTLGWKAFQDLCSQVCAEVLKRPVEIYREAQDGGQDAVFFSKRMTDGTPSPATIQCKFSTRPGRRLAYSDLKTEEGSIRKLVQLGEADTYILMTSMGVDAGIAQKVKERLRQIGVRKPHVFGLEFLTLAIRSSTRLRAMVPQVYGLGDLSVILDERRAEQTRALLGQWLPMLRLYVPTESHRKAVQALADHRIVLLLGNAATGKSTLAAILSTMACEGGRTECFQTTGPRDFGDRWNPNETNRFYWIDDAFGPNQPRDEYIQDWADAFRKVQAAIEAGNRFVLTSRRHIYEAAKLRLGSRNLSVFASRQAVVDVGALTLEEKEQILYNHIKAGNQSKHWKERVKEHLKAVAEAPHFLPGMARRLGDSVFTKHLPLTVIALRQFLSEPKDYLIRTIEELSDLHQATLALIFVHQGRMPTNHIDEDALELVSEAFNVDRVRLGRSIRELRGSFVAEVASGGATFWVFDHPTILDAATEMFRRDVTMTQIFLKGSKFETIAASVVCEDAPPIADAMIVPRKLNALLIRRITEAPDERASNRLLFSFLAERASDAVFSEAMSASDGLLSRDAGHYWGPLNYDAKILACARAKKLGIIDSTAQDNAIEAIEGAIFSRNDLSFMDNDNILNLVQPTRLMRIILRMRKDLLNELSDQVSSISREPDFDIDPPDNFQEFSSYLDLLREIFSDDEEALDTISDIAGEVDRAIDEIEQEKNARQRRLERERLEAEDEEWNHRVSRRPSSISSGRPIAVGQSEGRTRSIFSDVDE